MVAMATFSLLWLYLANSQVSVYRTIRPLVLNFSRIPPPTAELAALECLKNQHNLVSTLVPTFI